MTVAAHLTHKRNDQIDVGPVAERSRCTLCVEWPTWGTTSMKTRLPGLVALTALSLLAGAAHADVNLYSNDFESTLPGWASGFSGPTTLHREENQYTGRFNGKYSSTDAVTLFVANPVNTLPLGVTQRVTLKFDLYIIDSWDGDLAGYGPDHFIVRLNNNEVFNEAFSNQNDSQTFRAPDERFNMGWNGAPDAIYRDITVVTDIAPGTNMSYVFTSTPLTGYWDESWGIDNVRVSYTTVPTPGVATTALAGLGLAARRRRR